VREREREGKREGGSNAHDEEIKEGRRSSELARYIKEA